MFEVGDVIGQGGRWSIVGHLANKCFYAIDLETGQDVVVKYVGQVSRELDFVTDRFARTAAQDQRQHAVIPRHPNLVTHLSADSRERFVVMENVTGPTLSQLEEPLSWNRATQIILGVGKVTIRR